MSINVAVNPGPHERIVFDNGNVTVTLTNFQDKSVIVATGRLRLSNSRLTLEAKPVTYRVIGKGDREFRSLSASIIVKDGGVKESRLVQPWFGPNKWEAVLVPSSTSTLEPRCPWVLSVSFNSGGAFEFTQQFSALASAALAAHQEGIDEVLPPYQP